MLPRYHVNPETGNVSICRAKIQCRFGGSKVHYPSEKDARLAFERKMFRENNQVENEGVVTPLPDNLIVDEHRIGLPSGEYFICDPYQIMCLDRKGWNSWVNSVENKMGWDNDVTTPEDEKVTVVGALYNGKPIIAAKTWNGEGLNFSVQPARRIPNEVGLIGAIHMDIIKGLGLTYQSLQKKKLGMFYKFNNPVAVYRNEFGDVQFGGRLVVIPVNGNEKYFKVLDEASERTENDEYPDSRFDPEYYLKIVASRGGEDDYLTSYEDDYYDIPDDYDDYRGYQDVFKDYMVKETTGLDREMGVRYS